jgi:SAM-dependent methyltransferase
VLTPPTGTLAGVPTSYHHRGLAIPVELIRLTGQSNPDAYDETTRAQMVQLERRDLLRPDLAVLDIGCGFGRIGIELGEVLGADGSYIGIDIIKPSIDWAREHLTSQRPSLHFEHLDIDDKLHNPDGSVDGDTVRLPVDDGTIDLVVMMSVFTHMLPRTLSHYLHETARVLKPGGRALTTCFLYDRPTLRAARTTDLSEWHLFFPHRHGRGCRFNDTEYPTGAVAYSQRRITRMAAAAGLGLVEPPSRGNWSGAHPDAPDFQDAMCLERPASDTP